MCMRRLMIGILIFWGWAVPAHAGLVFTSYASSGAIQGRVVDDATGQPLAGVLVIATWHDFTPSIHLSGFHQGGGGGHSCDELVNALTAVTDANGNYEFPAWSGKSVHCRHMSIWQPYMVWYKPGYKALDTQVPLSENAEQAGPDDTGPVDEGVTRLPPVGSHHLEGNTDNQVLALENYVSSVGHAFGQDFEGPCFWNVEVPAVLMVLQEQRRLAAYMPSYIPPGTDLLHLDNQLTWPPNAKGHCMTPEAVSALEQEAM